MDDVYHNPRYYDIAFAFRDIGAEVDVFEAVIQRYGRISVQRMLDIGCGPGFDSAAFRDSV